jgi:hypothetical protein
MNIEKIQNLANTYQLSDGIKATLFRGLKGTSNIPSVQNLAHNFHQGEITAEEYINHFVELERKELFAK